MKKLFLENFRCFKTYREIPLAPLTLLVGENSTGKTSFLAAVRVAGSITNARNIDFNVEPFLLGAYEQIANFHDGLAKSFLIGQVTPVAIINDSYDVKIQTNFHSDGIHPQSIHWFFQSQEYQLEITPVAGEVVELKIKTPHFSDSLFLPSSRANLEFLNYVSFAIINNEKTPQTNETQGELAHIKDLILRVLASPTNLLPPYAIAPIRTKPRRTYDLVQDVPQPEGQHVPMVLARIVSGNPQEWLPLKESLEKFGRACGLFEEIEVKKLGDSKSSPFQIQFTINGLASNVMDVGYGVSQIVPVLVDSFRAPNGQTLLLQQPEVHLHPRAQAELGTFLGALAKHDDKQFIVETHSDHLVDRVCMDVRDNVLQPEDVVILYFERIESEVIIHPITVDAYGNLQNAPLSYRRFFLEEEGRYLGV